MIQIYRRDSEFEGFGMEKQNRLELRNNLVNPASNRHNKFFLPSLLL